MRVNDRAIDEEFQFFTGTIINLAWVCIQDTEAGNGVTITDMDDEESVAAKAGLQEKDMITAI